MRGDGSFAMATAAMDHLAAADFGPFKISIVVTRHNVDQLDAFEALADGYGAELRVTRLRPSGRGADTWHDLHPTNEQQRTLYQWLQGAPRRAHRRLVLPPLRAGRAAARTEPVRRRSGGLPDRPHRRRLRLPVRACTPEFKGGSVRDPGGFAGVWRTSELFAELREPQAAGACASCGRYDACQGGCMAAKFFTGLPLDGPDPECVNGHGEAALLAATAAGAKPSPGVGHSKPGATTRVALGAKPDVVAGSR